MTKERFTSPVMRFVQGDLDTPQDKDAQGNPRVVKTGPNAGQPNPQYFIAGAIRKDDPQWPAFWAMLCNAAAAGFPNLFPQGPTGPCVHPQFAFKVIDGDSPIPNQSGRLWNSYEGFPGHWVVRFASSYPPRLFHKDRYAPHEQIQEKGAIKRGYYIRVNGTVEANGNAQRPGLYVNLDMVELFAYGPEIVSGPDASEAFGNAPAAALPPGASPVPLTPPAAGPGVPSVPGTPAAPAPVAPPLPVPGAAPAAATPYPGAVSPAPASPAAPAAPYTGYMAPGAGPTPGGPAPAASPAPAAPTTPASPIASPTRVMLPAANGATYEQMIAAGWNDDTLRQHGMMQ